MKAELIEAVAAPIILICTNQDSGRIVSVGLYATMDDARRAAFSAIHGGGSDRRRLFSVWTPRMNENVEAASITGLSMPPKS